MPAFALVKITGKSACSSLAPSSTKRSKVWLTTSCGRASLAVDLVDDDDRAQVQLERLAQHEARLRHHAFGGIDQQQHALHHLQHALDLAAEIGVAGRIDDVELHVAVADRGVLRENRDAALALERIGVEDARRDLLALAKDAALLEHGVDQRRLAVIDVCNDGDVADIGACLHETVTAKTSANWPWMATIETARLLLRGWRDEDVEPWVEMNADPRVSEFLGRAYSRELSLSQVPAMRERLEERGYGWWVVQARGGPSFVGVIASKRFHSRPRLHPRRRLAGAFARSVGAAAMRRRAREARSTSPSSRCNWRRSWRSPPLRIFAPLR